MKAKSKTQILKKHLDQMHPLFQGYFFDRMMKSVEQIKEQLPEFIANEQATGNRSMFHPNFFVQYMNAIIDIHNEMYPNEKLEHEKYID